MIASLALCLTLSSPRFTVSCVLPDKHWLGVTKSGLVAERVAGAVRYVTAKGKAVGTVSLPQGSTAELDGDGNLVTITPAVDRKTAQYIGTATIEGPVGSFLPGQNRLVFVDDATCTFVTVSGKQTKSIPATPGPQGTSVDVSGVTGEGEVVGSYRKARSDGATVQPFVLSTTGFQTLPLPKGYSHGTVSARIGTALFGGVAVSKAVDPDMVGVSTNWPPLVNPWRPVEWRGKPALLPTPSGVASYRNWSLLPLSSFGGLLLGRLQYSTSEIPYAAELMAWSGSQCIPLASLCAGVPSGYVIDSAYPTHSDKAMLVHLIQPSTSYSLYAVIVVRR